MKAAHFFIRSAGALLVAVALALLLSNFAAGEVAQPLDPLLRVSIRTLFWICGAVFLLLGLTCLFGRWEFTQLALLAWVSVNLMVYVAGLRWTGVSSPVFLFGSLGDTFGLSPQSAMRIGGTVLAYVFCGSLVMMFLVWRGARAGKWAVHPDQFSKIFCPACGGHIQYPKCDAEREIPCPHCAAAIKLVTPGNLKMSCYFCKGHIEFASHAIGTKMPCPHCKKDITLKELPVQ